MNGYGDFSSAVKELLDGTAGAKGYHTGGPNGDNPLYRFVRDFIGGHPDAHALGEVIYKVVRYVRKGNVEDLHKAAAWLFLVVHHREQK